MPRILITPDDISASRITITDSFTLHHLARVLRIKSGEHVECFDGQGQVVAGTVASCTKQAVTIEIDRRWQEQPPACAITLMAALIKPERFEWMVEKATELGVAVIMPLITQRTTVRAPMARSDSRLARWRRIAESAAAQCGRAVLPVIDPPAAFPEAVTAFAGRRAFIPTLLGTEMLLTAALAAHPPAREVVLLIGPEGDFTPEEVALARAHGAVPVSLGRLTLRAETAAVAAITMVQAAYGDMAVSS